jgi:hypothetical protein
VAVDIEVIPNLPPVGVPSQEITQYGVVVKLFAKFTVHAVACDAEAQVTEPLVSLLVAERVPLVQVVIVVVPD